MALERNPTIEKRARRWLANKLAGWARRIYPQSEEVMSFYMDRMVDLAITGQSVIKITRVPPEDVAPVIDGSAD